MRNAARNLWRATKEPRNLTSAYVAHRDSADRSPDMLEAFPALLFDCVLRGREACLRPDAKRNCMNARKPRSNTAIRQNRFVASVEQVNPIPKDMPGEANNAGDFTSRCQQRAPRSREFKQDAYPTLILPSPPWISTPRRGIRTDEPFGR
jgi:hypothetical protein